MGANTDSSNGIYKSENGGLKIILLNQDADPQLYQNAMDFKPEPNTAVLIAHGAPHGVADQRAGKDFEHTKDLGALDVAKLLRDSGAVPEYEARQNGQQGTRVLAISCSVGQGSKAQGGYSMGEELSAYYREVKAATAVLWTTAKNEKELTESADIYAKSSEGIADKSKPGAFVTYHLSDYASGKHTAEWQQPTDPKTLYGVNIPAIEKEVERYKSEHHMNEIDARTYVNQHTRDVGKDAPLETDPAKMAQPKNLDADLAARDAAIVHNKELASAFEQVISKSPDEYPAAKEELLKQNKDFEYAFKWKELYENIVANDIKTYNTQLSLTHDQKVAAIDQMKKNTVEVIASGNMDTFKVNYEAMQGVLQKNQSQENTNTQSTSGPQP